METPIQITDSARKEIVETFTANKIPDSYGLRVGIKGGGCSGSLLLGFDTPGEHDREYTVAGIKVYIDRRHLMYVLGALVDFEENDEQSGFTISSTKKEN